MGEVLSKVLGQSGLMQAALQATLGSESLIHVFLSLGRWLSTL